MFFAAALDPFPTRELGDVCGATGREPAVCLPQHRPIDHRLIGAGGCGFAGAPTTSDPGWIDPGADHNAAGPVDLHANLSWLEGGQCVCAVSQPLIGGGGVN